MKRASDGRFLRVLCGAVACVGAAAALAAPDAALLDAARRAEPAVIESLKEMAQIESGSQDAEGLARMAD